MGLPLINVAQGIAASLRLLLGSTGVQGRLSQREPPMNWFHFILPDLRFTRMRIVGGVLIRVFEGQSMINSSMASEQTGSTRADCPSGSILGF